ncbi:MAG: GWxTD domain-containing protein [Candidatus Solibacter usitatus]|nr:GWxTD domain-containing protein [Candidatus Solibacter usitatus]
MSAEQALGWALVHFLWQGAVAGLAAAVMLAVLRSPQARYAAGCGVMLGMALAPVVTFFVLWRDRVVLDVALPAAGSGAGLAAGAAGWNPDWLHLLTQAWMAGASVLLLRSAGGWWLAWSRSRAGQGRLLFVREGVRVYESAGVRAPQAFGWLRPVVLAPACAVIGLTPEQLEAVIAHELAHVRRHDYVVNLAQTVVESLLFYHPAVWWVSSRVRRHREECCDEAAVAACGDRVLYSTALLRLEESRVEFAMAASGSGLKERIGRLLGMEQRGYSMTPALSLAAVALMWGCAVWAQGEPQAPPAAAPAPAPAPAARPKPPVPPPAPPPPPAASSPDLERMRAELYAKEAEMRRIGDEMRREGERLRAEVEKLRPQLDAMRAEFGKAGGDLAVREKIAAEVGVRTRIVEEVTRTIEAQIRALEKELQGKQKALERTAVALSRQKEMQMQAELYARAAEEKARGMEKEFERRIEYADGKFAEPGKKGSETDRGKVYLKNGPPDMIESHPGGKEEWRYRDGAAFQFENGVLKVIGKVI